MQWLLPDRILRGWWILSSCLRFTRMRVWRRRLLVCAHKYTRTFKNLLSIIIIIVLESSQLPIACLLTSIDCNTDRSPSLYACRDEPIGWWVWYVSTTSTVISYCYTATVLQTTDKVEWNVGSWRELEVVILYIMISSTPRDVCVVCTVVIHLSFAYLLRTYLPPTFLFPSS